MAVVNNLKDRGFTVYKRAKRAIKNYRLRRRRARSAKRRSVGRRTTIALSLILVLLFAAFAWALRFLSPEPEGRQLSIDELSALADEKRIATATFLDEDNLLVGTYAAEPLIEEEPRRRGGQDRAGRQGERRARDRSEGRGGGTEQPQEGPASKAPPGAGSYYLVYPSSDAAFGALSEMVTAAGARVEIDPQTSKATVRIVSTYLLPLLILASFFGLLFSTGRGGGAGIGEVLTFGQIGKKRRRRGFAQPTTFADVGGEQEAVEELKEVVDYLRDPERYEEIGAVPPKGVLLFGPPGCGKTLLAKAVAGEAGVPFFSVAGAEFVESLVGVGAARVRDLFQRVRAVAPAIVFIDELDAAGRRRGHGDGGGGSDEREQTLNQLLVEMDGFEVSSGIVVIGATNRPDILDPALLRPGRFDRHITVDTPDFEGRKEILRLHSRGKPVAASVDYDYLAKRTPGFSGADLANVMNEAALLSIRLGKSEIETPELEEAIQRVLHGPKRRGVVMQPEERERAAFHEAGHAIVAAALRETEDLHRVSILPRGRGLGVFGIQRESDRLLFTRDQLYARLVIAMGGLAAEELNFGQPSTGAEQDLEQATETARDIVGRYGMSPGLGRARLLASDIDQFLGNDSGYGQLSEQTHQAFDAEVQRLLGEAEREAKRLLTRNRAALERLALRLQREETVEGAALDEELSDVAGDLSGLSAPFSSNGQGRVSASTRI
jgi:cell division protease FtsH